MYYEKNVELLEKNYPDIYCKIKDISINDNEFEIIKSKNKFPTLRINSNGRSYYLHSKYNPIKEAEIFAEKNYNDNVLNYVVYGFGFAYHIEKLLELNHNIELYVFETNKYVFKAALENIDLSDLIKNPKVHIIVEDDINIFVNRFRNLLKLENKKFIIHLPSLQSMPRKFEEIRYLLEEFRVQEHSMLNASNILDKNFEKNIKNYDKNIDVLFKKFIDIPLVLVSAGPSLDKNKTLLKKVKNRAIILAVGRAVKPLIREGIYPDIIIITDPYDIVYNQLEGLDIKIPIIVLSTCSEKVMNNYKGYKFIALQEGYYLAEKYAKENGNMLIRTGGSVATTALDIAIKFGCNPIIFVGQDLAYTNGRSHARDTYLCQEIIMKENLRKVEGIDGKPVFTTKSLSIFRRWIENRIEKEKRVTFIDATEGGAKIRGTIIMTLKEVIEEKLKDRYIDFTRVLEEVVEKSD
ncbi:6-hydroxymethylpterin diphosphokinase MptE-like protein [Caloranaerobacter ferrireducens]|uniref:motility associated factor glycosyltransferase family protein n=1 Tax=Caloranaerobacter ferrireducens TaxID=1323370 RepID=UPI00084E087A|nr:6-hydroxymethylpterin diphosphokinase MptE-like protein [Caloranaerobacter ferrireducens]